MVERGAKVYVYLADRLLATEPEPGASWDDHLTTSIGFGPDDDVYLLTVSYTTGNSFGRDPEIHHECIDLYADQALAAEQARKIRAHYDRTRNFRARQEMTYEETSEVEIKLGSGEDMRYQGPWLGHFERVEEIEVALVGLRPKAVLKF